MFRKRIESHFERLRKLVRLEELEEADTFRREIRDRTPEERERSGRALLRLSLAEAHYNAAGHSLLTFRYADGKPLPIFSLDAGDMVRLAASPARDSEEWLSGTVYERTDHSITIAFNRDLAQWAEEDTLYDLTRGGGRGSFKKIYEALEKAARAEHGRLAYLRDVFLGLKAPRESDPVKLESLSFFNARLDEAQKKAVKMFLESPDVCMIQGPPGTGKTTVLVEVIRQAVAQGKFVFATAPSNAACDHLLSWLVQAGVPALRLGHPARIMTHLRAHTLDFKVSNHPYGAAVDEKQAEIARLRLKLERRRERRPLSWEEKGATRQAIRDLENEVRDLASDIFLQVLREAPVMVGTHAGAGDPVLEGKKYDVLVMDESAQATEPSSWIPLLRAERVVLAGDHFQLPPTIRSPEAERKGLGVSLFERLYDMVPDRFTTMLDCQYRMHESIMNFSSREFYGGSLMAHASVRSHKLADLGHVKQARETEETFVFLDTAGRGYEEAMEEGSESRYNAEEAGLVLEELGKLLNLGLREEEIGIISPYRAQIRLLLAKLGPTRLEVSSVDSFQGREKEAVIVSLVRSNVEGELGFLADTRRMNVAMTRARRKLMVIGDSSTLCAIPFYRDFIQYAESIGAYRSSWEAV